jgi:hypothetical protein
MQYIPKKLSGMHMNIRVSARCALFFFFFSAAAGAVAHTDLKGSADISPLGITEIDESIVELPETLAAKKCVLWIPGRVVAGEWIPGFCAKWSVALDTPAPVVAKAKRCIWWVPGQVIAGEWIPGFCAKWSAALNTPLFEESKRCIAWVPARVVGGQYFPQRCVYWSGASAFRGGSDAHDATSDADLEIGRVEALEEHDISISAFLTASANRCVAWIPGRVVNGQWIPGFCAKWASLSQPFDGDIAAAALNATAADDNNSVALSTLAAKTRDCLFWVPGRMVSGQWIPGFCAKWASLSPLDRKIEHEAPLLAAYKASPPCITIFVNGRPYRYCPR